METVKILTEIESVQTMENEVIVICSDTPQELKVSVESTDFLPIVSLLIEAWRDDSEITIEFLLKDSEIKKVIQQ